MKKNTYIHICIIILWFVKTNLIGNPQKVPLHSRHSPISTDILHLEDEYRMMIKSEAHKLSFVFPKEKKCVNESWDCLDYLKSISKDTSGPLEASYRVRPLLAQNYNYQSNNFSLSEIGILASGKKGPLSFYVDTRMFMGIGEVNPLYSDFEDKDSQNENVTGSITYSSYNRTRANVNLETDYGKFSISKDAMQWGPSLYSNLTFSKEAAPYYHFIYSDQWGPLRVVSLYADLNAGETQGFSSENSEEKNLYAHRYELEIHKYILIGLNEQLILYNQRKPYLIIPILPLFSAKTNSFEEYNNGAISGDVAIRLPPWGLLYGEFYLDDLESPSSLILKNYAQNKWGFNLGVHTIYSMANILMGSTLEYTRIEPWVYTHFKENTSQMSHIGQPIGNPVGPNSQQILIGQYAKFNNKLSFNSLFRLQWKGTELGSNINDAYSVDHTSKKKFLGENPTFKLIWEPEIFLTWKKFQWYSQFSIGHENAVRVRLGYVY